MDKNLGILELKNTSSSDITDLIIYAENKNQLEMFCVNLFLFAMTLFLLIVICCNKFLLNFLV